jgi:hypothetical protein
MRLEQMRGLSVKTLKRTLKKAGLKTSGRKAALTRRAKKAHLLRGGAGACTTDKGTPGNCTPLGPEPVGRLPGNRYGGRGTRRGGADEEPAGLSNVTPPQGPPPTELPEWAKDKSKGGRHRRGHRSRKNKGGMYGHTGVKYCHPPGKIEYHTGRCVA